MRKGVKREDEDEDEYGGCICIFGFGVENTLLRIYERLGAVCSENRFLRCSLNAAFSAFANAVTALSVDLTGSAASS